MKSLYLPGVQISHGPAPSLLSAKQLATPIIAPRVQGSVRGSIICQQPGPSRVVVWRLTLIAIQQRGQTIWCSLFAPIRKCFQTQKTKNMVAGGVQPSLAVSVIWARSPGDMISSSAFNFTMFVQLLTCSLFVFQLGTNQGEDVRAINWFLFCFN